MLDLGDRMKMYYENVTRNHLVRRTPIIIRLDGKSFHTWTNTTWGDWGKWCQRPFDDNLSKWMAETTKYLVDNIQGAVFGFTQSDEISILLRDYDTFETQSWFDGNIQKIASVSASMCTAKFNKLASTFTPMYFEYGKMSMHELPLAFFDSRCFNINKEDTCNYFVWRQQDVIRNSVQMLGQHFLGHKNIQGLNNLAVVDKLRTAGVDLDSIPQHFKCGVAYSRNSGLDYRTPLFTTNREYVERHIHIKENTNDK